MNYAMLHTHSVYSIRDSISTVDEYVKKINQINQASEHKITSLALTEHGNLFSTLKLNNATKGTDVHPVYGVEMYHVLKDTELETLNTKNTYHLILLAKTQQGLRNIMNISTHGGNNAKGHRFITSIEYIRENNLGEGVICLTACFGGYVARHIDRGEYEKSKEFLEDIKELFDETYLEIQPHHNFPAQIVVNSKIKELSKETNTEIVLTTDTHYVEKEDRKYRDLLMHSKTESEEDEESEEFCDLHVHTVEELMEFCDKFDFDYSVIERTHDIASRCNSTVELDDPMALMPSYPCPEGYTEESYLREKATSGLEFRLSNAKGLANHPQEYISRLEYELDVVISTGFCGYFLILWDWFSWCKSEGIVLGPGRGSAAGSMLAYVLDITKVDPLKNGLIFERFLTRERAEVPDIDSDVSRDDRPRAIAYLKEKYGSDQVCQIVTFGKYKVKSTIKFLLSSKNGFTSDFQNEITKLIPAQVEGREVTYELMEYFAKRSRGEIEPSSQYEGVFIDSSDRDKDMILRAYATIEDVCVEYPQVRDGLLKFNETIASIGLHAGGVVISSKKIMDYIPLMKGSASAVLQVCQADMSDITQYNMLKIDALGLKTLSQIDLCLKLANIDRSWLDVEETDDKKVYKFLRDGNTFNVFQMHKGTPTAMIKNFKVKDLEGLTAVNAGNRPGPLAKGENGKSMVDTFIENASAKNKISFDPRIDHILESTNMCLWYQEHCMNLGMIMAGYSLGTSDLRIRKTLGN